MMQHILRRWSGLLLILVAVIWFGNLEYRTLVKPDEGRYAEIPREMVVSGDWVTPRLNDLKYFEKPPLQYWATAVAYEAFGEHQWTSRLWTALTGFLGLFLTWFAGSRLFGREAGYYAALLLGGSWMYAMMGHINTLDMGVTFFVTLGIFGLLLAQYRDHDARTQRNWMLLAWAGLALAVLSKGLMGIILPGTALVIYSVVQRDFAVWKRMHWLSGLALFLLITVPWFVLVIKANPEFFERFFIYEHFTRFTTKKLGRYQPWYYFVPILLIGMLPWTLLMIDTAVRTWRNSARVVQTFNPQRFLLVWAVFIYVFFSVSGSKLPSYLLPMFPALALLMGKQLAEMDGKRLFWLIVPFVPLMALGIGLASQTPKLANNPDQAALYAAYVPWLVGAAGIMLFGLLLGSGMVLRRNKLMAVSVIAFCSLLAAQVGLSGYNTAARERSALHIAKVIQPLVKPETPLYSVLTYEQTLTFYLKHTFTLVAYKDEMDFGILQEPQRWIPDLETFGKVWQNQPHALAIMPVYVYPLLEKQGVPMRIVFKDYQHIVVSKP